MRSWTHKDKKRYRRGFTLAETLMAVMILMLVASVVAAGIPSAANALGRVVDASNAQVLLSTTMGALRDELASADDIIVADGGSSVSYTDSMHMASVISYSDDDGIRLQKWSGLDSEDGDPSVDRLLVSGEAATSSLSAKYEKIEYDEDAGTVTVKNLQVVRDGKAVAGPCDYVIGVID